LSERFIWKKQAKANSTNYCISSQSYGMIWQKTAHLKAKGTIAQKRYGNYTLMEEFLYVLNYCINNNMILPITILFGLFLECDPNIKSDASYFLEKNS